MFKYDKNGCRVSGCRLTSTTDLTDDLAVASISIYPNPVSDVLKIKHYGIRETTDVIITDITGIAVMKGYLNDGLNEVDVSHFKSGIYLVSIMQNGRILKTEKFVKM